MVLFEFIDLFIFYSTYYCIFQWNLSKILSKNQVDYYSTFHYSILAFPIYDLKTSGISTLPSGF